MLNNSKTHYIISALAIGGIAFAALNFNNQPLFENTDDFVLFAKEEIKLEQGTQVSSGDIGSNEEIDIQKDVIINGNLFADEIELDKNTIINGNASFNKLEAKKEAQILGEQISPVSLPIANLPEIPDFQISTQDFKFEDQDNILSAGNYKNITLEKNSRLVLEGGIYNISKLFLNENSTLIYSAQTTLNIQEELKTQQKTSILPGQNLKPDDLTINYKGQKAEKEEKKDKKDKNKDKNKENDNQHSKPIEFGKQSFLNFKLLAPKADVHVGEKTILRGQILARKIKVEKGGILSLDISGSIQPRLSDIVLTDEGERIVINQIILQLTTAGTLEDAQEIAESINGSITGIVASIDLYQILVNTQTVSELDAVIQQLLSQQNPKIKNMSKNIILNLIQ